MILALPFAPRAYGLSVERLQKYACKGKRVYDIGRAYEIGDGVEKNMPKAAAWYMISMKVQSPLRLKSRDRLEAITETMTGSEAAIVPQEIRNINRECGR